MPRRRPCATAGARVVLEASGGLTLEAPASRRDRRRLRRRRRAHALGAVLDLGLDLETTDDGSDSCARRRGRLVHAVDQGRGARCRYRPRGGDRERQHPPTSPPVSEQDPRVVGGARGGDGTARRSPPRCRRHLGRRPAARTRAARRRRRSGAASKLWNDTTSAPQAERLVVELGTDQWAAMTVQRPVASFTISKLAWVAEHEPEVLARAPRVMLPHDYLTWRLCGSHVTDRGDASGTGWFDPVGRVPPPARRPGRGRGRGGRRLPDVLGPTEAAGSIRGRARELGLAGRGHRRRRQRRQHGRHARARAAQRRRGDLARHVGHGVRVSRRRRTRDESGAVAGFATRVGRTSRWCARSTPPRSPTRWRRWLGTDAAGCAELALGGRGDPGDVVLVPYFDGERTPNLPDATGTSPGSRTSTTRQLVLAAHDGVLCGLLHGLDACATSARRSTAGLPDRRRLAIPGLPARCADLRRRRSSCPTPTRPSPPVPPCRLPRSPAAAPPPTWSSAGAWVRAST